MVKILNVVPVTENIGGRTNYTSSSVMMAGDSQGMNQYAVTFEHEGHRYNINVCVHHGKSVTKDDIISALLSKIESLEDNSWE